MFYYWKLYENKMVKTTIEVLDSLWKKFSIRVIEEHGGGKKNEIIIGMIENYIGKK